MFLASKSAVRGGSGYSEFFPVESGLRQGCVISPLLFSIFVDDLPQLLEGGIRVGNVRINILMYCDDIVIISDHPAALQRNINILAKYFNQWNLILNHEKSKIMIFRRGGRLAANEKWFYNGKRIDVVESYKYLGVSLTSKLSFINHLKSRVASAKVGINTIWKNFVCNRVIPLKAKYQVFNAVSRSVVSYGCQVWGFQEYEVVEVFQRYFLRKLFALPDQTPTHLLYLETSVDPIYFYTFKLHTNYCLRTLELTANRLPRIVSEAVIDSQVSWFASWREAFKRYNLPFILLSDNRLSWRAQLDELKKVMKVTIRDGYLKKASESDNFLLYRTLVEVDRNLGSLFSSDSSLDLGLNDLRLLLKIRCELLPLNANLCLKKDEEEENCPFCRPGTKESLFHFMSECPKYEPERRLFFGEGVVPGHRMTKLILESHVLVLKFVKSALSSRSRMPL